MPTTVATQRGSDPAASTTPTPTVDATLQLSTQTLAWLADQPHLRQMVVGSVWDKLTELERAGEYPGAIAALRRVLSQVSFIYHDVTWQDATQDSNPEVSAPAGAVGLAR